MKTTPTSRANSFVGFFLALGLLTVSAHAAAVAVPNFSFEDPVTLNPGDYTNGNANGVNSAIMADWIYTLGSGSNSYGVQYTTTDQFNAGQVTGNQFGYINSNDALASITSGTLATVAAATDYTFTVALGKRLDSPSFTDQGQFVLSILVDGSSVSSAMINGTSLTAGSLTDYSAVWSSGAVSTGNLAVQISWNNVFNPGPGNVSQGPFDNARLDAVATPVPEPSVTALASCLLLVLVVAGRRMRSKILVS